jgi:flagellin
LLSIPIDMTTSSVEYNIDFPPAIGFDLNAELVTSFAGVSNLDMSSFNAIDATNLESSIFGLGNLSLTLASITEAINNVNKAASYVGGVLNRLNSQEDLLKSQITNYNAAISRIEDADVALEQLELVKAQFLQQASLVSLAQANQNPQAFLQLLQP